MHTHTKTTMVASRTPRPALLLLAATAWLSLPPTAGAQNWNPCNQGTQDYPDLPNFPACHGFNYTAAAWQNGDTPMVMIPSNLGLVAAMERDSDDMYFSAYPTLYDDALATARPKAPVNLVSSYNADSNYDRPDHWPVCATYDQYGVTNEMCTCPNGVAAICNEDDNTCQRRLDPTTIGTGLQLRFLNGSVKCERRSFPCVENGGEGGWGHNIDQGMAGSEAGGTPAADPPKCKLSGSGASEMNVIPMSNDGRLICRCSGPITKEQQYSWASDNCPPLSTHWRDGGATPWCMGSTMPYDNRWSNTYRSLFGKYTYYSEDTPEFPMTWFRAQSTYATSSNTDGVGTRFSMELPLEFSESGNYTVSLYHPTALLKLRPDKQH